MAAHQSEKGCLFGKKSVLFLEMSNTQYLENPFIEAGSHMTGYPDFPIPFL
jgi:hypothetical protein